MARIRLDARAINTDLNHDPDDPKWSDVLRTLAAIMREYQHDQFVNAFDLDEPAETTCTCHLMTGNEECPTARRKPITTRQAQPHKPPLCDHATVWLDDGELTVYPMYVYLGNIERLEAAKPPYNQWFDLFEFAAEWGLEVSILEKSWYNLSSTVQVVFYSPERYR